MDIFGPTTPFEPADVPDLLPVLPLRDLVLYPYIIVPLSVSRDRSVRAVDAALAGRRMLLLLAQRSEAVDDPGWEDLHLVGTVAVILRVLKLPDDRVRLLVQGVARARVLGTSQEDGVLTAKVEQLPEPSAAAGRYGGGSARQGDREPRVAPPEAGAEATSDLGAGRAGAARLAGESDPSTTEDADMALESRALVRSAKSALERVVALGKNVSSEVIVIANNLDDPGRLADLIASNLDLAVSEAQRVLELLSGEARLRAVLVLLGRETDLLQMQQRIASSAKTEIDRTQREYYLRQQLKAIERELGDSSEGLAESQQLREKIAKAGMPQAVRDDVLRQADKLSRMPADGAEAATLRAWLDWMTTLPWSRVSRERIDLARARQVLDRDHHGLERVKDRILEHLAVRKLNPRARGSLLCFLGPPGVGKTSLGRSIAEATGRKFTRMSLGGVRDEAEIRGHRRTYVGALPGRILQGLVQAGTGNPVFMIDEVDKIGADFRGDPSSALLEVLDPEQNDTFRDHYLNVPYDLSRVMFILTANLLDPIQPALRDRLEVIRIEGYSEEEKLCIARRHLLPRAIAEHGLLPAQARLPESVIRALVRGWTREAGLRNLERELKAVLRKVARGVAEGKWREVAVTVPQLARWLGAPRLASENLPARDTIGVATGLAWTAAGGEVLEVEAVVYPGRGKLVLTGQLGEVMRESARAALSYLQARADELRIPRPAFAGNDLHVHVAEGAIPKDGPSAGLAIAAALASALTGRPVRRGMAMTGEVTLRGRVLGVGGIKEKLLGARRAGVSRIVLPAPNRREVAEIPAAERRGLRIVYVDDVGAALARVLA